VRIWERTCRGNSITDFPATQLSPIYKIGSKVPEMLFRSATAHNPRLKLLKNVVLFKDISMRDLTMVDNLLHERRYLADEVIFDEGEEGQGLFVVLEGRVKVARPGNPSGKLLEFGPGSFFGEVALLDQSARTAQARALEDTHIVALFRAEFYSLLETHSAIASRISFQLARVLAARLRLAVNQIDNSSEVA
jgi:CRP/FNR family cyclic AMP-dependent transcriptional regulator